MNKQAAKLELEAIKDRCGYQAMSEKRWDEISREECLSENFLVVYANKLKWAYISYYQKVSVEFIRSGAYESYYEVLAQNDHITVDMYEQLKDLIPFDAYILNKNADSDFLLQHKDQLNEENIKNINFELLTEKAVLELFPLIKGRTYFYTKTTLTKPVLEKYENQLAWKAISFHSKLTEEALIAFAHRINWENYIWSNPNPVPEQVIEEKGLLRNPSILTQIVRNNKNLSEEFIREHSKWFAKEFLYEQNNAPVDLLVKANLNSLYLYVLLSRRHFNWSETLSLLGDTDDYSVNEAVFLNQDFDLDFYEERLISRFHQNHYLYLKITEMIRNNTNLNLETKEHIETMEQLKNLFN